MTLPEPSDRRVIRRPVPANHPIRDIHLTEPLDLTR